jgi:hypothetical protein
MPNQVVSTEKKIIFPDGSAFEVSDDNGSSYTSVGVLEGGVVFTYNFDKIEVETGNAGDLSARIKNEKLALAPSAFLSWNPEVWEKFGGGALTYTAIANTPVPGATQDILSGVWAFEKFIKIENQNYDGGAITVNTVTGSIDGALTVTTQYVVSQNEKGEYGITILTSGAATLAQDIEIDYDYTPAAGKQVTAGTSSLVLDDFIVRVRHYTDDALTLWDSELMVYSVDMDSGLSFNMKGANEDGVNSITVAMTAKNKLGNSDGDQLFKLTINEAAYGE